MKQLALLILDGWGILPDKKVSAIAAANTPVMNRLMSKYPHATLTTFGEDVGLPEGQMGNSEVGHTNIGAGRVVYQELARINKAIRENELLSNQVLINALQFASNNSKRIHLLGLVSDGGVHSHVQHLTGLCALLKKHAADSQVFIHAFTDGRDTDPKSGISFINQVEEMTGQNIHLATVVGRYYAMDRDKRWDRVKLAYDLLVHGKGTITENLTNSILKSYGEGVTDEFLLPLINKESLELQPFIQQDDVVLFFNFRTDRPRQLTEVLSQKDMHEFDMHMLRLHYVTFTNYDQTFQNVSVIFEKENLTKTLGEVISEQGLSQLRIAETEKYPHVTFFFNGGTENPFAGEDRIMVPSPKVATYDKAPEMSAGQITDKLIDYVNQNQPDFICLNYANTDMVGHTGDFEAAIAATEFVDAYLGKITNVLLEKGYYTVIIADHGNSDVMRNPDGSPNTAHTTNPVPVLLAGPDVTTENYTVLNGKLSDIAPSILAVMGINPPSEMTGNCIFIRK